MSGAWLLIVMLAAAAFGALVTDGRAGARPGLPSGAEWLIVGFGLGPNALGVFSGETVREFQPLVVAGLAWVTLSLGVDFGWVGERRLPWGGMLRGALLAALCAAAVWAALWALGQTWPRWVGANWSALTFAVVVIACETTPQAAAWFAERNGARGPLLDRISEVADADVVVPLGLLTVLLARHAPGPILPGSWWTGIPVTLGLGIGLGLVAAALLRRMHGQGETWSVLLGASLLVMGITQGLGLSALSCTFFMGLTLMAASGRHQELRRLMSRSERPVLLPILLVGGASVELAHIRRPVLIALAVALLVRFVVRAVSGYAVAGRAARARGAAVPSGLSLLASGSLTMSLGLYAYLTLSEQLGAAALVGAIAFTLLGEVIAPPSLRRALVLAGELPQPSEGGRVEVTRSVRESDS